MEFIGVLGMAKIHAINGDLKRRHSNDGHASIYAMSYPGNTWGTGVSFAFFSVKGKPAISIACNPTRMADDDWADFLGLLETMFPYGPKQVWETFRISALEVAVDVKVPVGELICLAPKVTMFNTGFHADGSLYLGHKFGRRSYCIYDKRKQLAEKKKVDLSYDLTRIEATLRQTGKTLGQLVEFSKPFGNLLAFRRAELVKLRKKFPLSIELYAFAKAVLGGGLAQQAYADLDPYSRKKLLKLLKPVALDLNADTHHWTDWIAAQQVAIQKKFLGGL